MGIRQQIKENDQNREIWYKGGHNFLVKCLSIVPKERDLKEYLLTKQAVLRLNLQGKNFPRRIGSIFYRPRNAIVVEKKKSIEQQAI